MNDYHTLDVTWGSLLDAIFSRISKYRVGRGMNLKIKI